MQILQLDSSGQPNKWVSWETAVTYYAKGLVTWSMGDDGAITVHGGKNRDTGLQSIIVASPIIAVRGDSKRKHRVPTLNNRQLFRRDHHLCAYCGKVFSEGSLSRDHIVPVSRGGANTWNNTITACNSCNAKKDDRTPEEAGMKLLYIPYTPSRNESLLLQNRNILACQMEFLLAAIPPNSRAHAYAQERHGQA